MKTVKIIRCEDMPGHAGWWRSETPDQVVYYVPKHLVTAQEAGEWSRPPVRVTTPSTSGLRRVFAPVRVGGFAGAVALPFHPATLAMAAAASISAAGLIQAGVISHWFSSGGPMPAPPSIAAPAPDRSDHDIKEAPIPDAPDKKLDSKSVPVTDVSGGSSVTAAVGDTISDTSVGVTDTASEVVGEVADDTASEVVGGAGEVANDTADTVDQTVDDVAGGGRDLLSGGEDNKAPTDDLTRQEKMEKARKIMGAMRGAGLSVPTSLADLAPDTEQEKDA